jgi:AraC family transcriptional regulator
MTRKMNAIQYINEGNKESLNKPANTDQIYYSELNEWFTLNAFRSLSVKVVLEGAIYYKADNREYKLQKDQFLLAPKQPNVKAYFNSAKVTKSICIDICEESLDEAFTVLLNEQKNELTDYGADYLKQPYFSESIYGLQQNELGAKLDLLTKRLQLIAISKDVLSINRELFLEMVELIVLTEFKNYKLLNNLHVCKTSTKKEILKRIVSGQEFIDQWFLTNPDIKTVARESNMSEFHFFRCFKQVFGVSPYQYMLNKRLEYASLLLSENDLLISEIARKCGFPDLFTFSKAFKKKFGVSPSKNFPKRISRKPSRLIF